MRVYALSLIILIDIIVMATRDMTVKASGLSFLLTMIVVVVVAFAVSALLRNMKNLNISRNYTYSGVIGMIVGILFFFWVRSNTEALINWFENYGLSMLMIVNIICALYIFFVHPKKKTAATQE